MPNAAEPLTFELLDDLMLAREHGRLPALAVTAAESIGPVIAFIAAGRALKGIACAPSPIARAIAAAGRTGKPSYALDRTIGAAPARRRLYRGEDSYREAFLFALRQAMVAAGWPKEFAWGMAGALGEMESNIHEHSAAVHTGILAYRVTRAEVEWVASDTGIGVLKGFQDGAYPLLRDSAEALKLALTDGCSRLGIAGHGNGFRPLFRALSARHGRLRFRSDDQLLTIAGDSPALSRARLHQRARVPGFSVNVVCAR
jgi:hypothetical protein